MKIERITFQQTFNTGQYENQKLSIEIAITDVDYEAHEDNEEAMVKEAFEYAKKYVNDCFKSMNPGQEISINPEYAHHFGNEYPYGPAGPPANFHQEKKKSAVQSIIEDINSCTAISEKNKWGNEIGLLVYKDSASQSPEIQIAYDKKYKELQP